MLKKLGACNEAVAWAGDKSLKEAWETCERADWMFWLCEKMKGIKGWPSEKEIVFAACDCAELVLPYFTKKYPDDNRPRLAIETARAWAIGKASLMEVRDAAAVAYAAADATDEAEAYAAAVGASIIAGGAVAEAVVAVAAAAAAAAGVDYAAAEKVRHDTHIKCSNIIRQCLKINAE